MFLVYFMMACNLKVFQYGFECLIHSEFIWMDYDTYRLLYYITSYQHIRLKSLKKNSNMQSRPWHIEQEYNLMELFHISIN